MLPKLVSPEHILQANSNLVKLRKIEINKVSNRVNNILILIIIVGICILYSRYRYKKSDHQKNYELYKWFENIQLLEEENQLRTLQQTNQLRKSHFSNNIQ